MVTVRDLRRTVRLVQSGCVTFFPEEAHGLQLIKNTLEADLQQVELDGQRITQHLLTAQHRMRTESDWQVLVARLHEDCGSTTYTWFQLLMEA